MTSVTGIAGSGAGSAVAVPSAPVVPPTAPTASTNAPAQASVVGGERVVNNPLARVIVTQYLDDSSNVVSQVPSSAVVAYLQNGLSPDGSPKKSSVA